MQAWENEHVVFGVKAQDFVARQFPFEINTRLQAELFEAPFERTEIISITDNRKRCVSSRVFERVEGKINALEREDVADVKQSKWAILFLVRLVWQLLHF